MAKKKKKRGKQSVVSKVANVLLMLLAFSKPLELIIRNPNAVGVEQIMFQATGGANVGRFSVNNLVGFYAPVAAAVGLGAVKSYIMKKFPVRG